MFVVTCGTKSVKYTVWSLASGKARELSIFEMEHAYVWSDDEPSVPFAEFVNGCQVDKEDARTFKIG